jgi:hypothetical protein
MKRHFCEAKTIVNGQMDFILHFAFLGMGIGQQDRWEILVFMEFLMVCLMM